jgi:hypothetical protein
VVAFLGVEKKSMYEGWRKKKKEGGMPAIYMNCTPVVKGSLALDVGKVC